MVTLRLSVHFLIFEARKNDARTDGHPRIGRITVRYHIVGDLPQYFSGTDAIANYHSLSYNNREIVQIFGIIACSSGWGTKMEKAEVEEAARRLGVEEKPLLRRIMKGVGIVAIVLAVLLFIY
ncbi:MAG: hypothetical protein ACFFB3_12540, partial [Candidatus Hodarchaeota archaeon]